MKKSKKKTFSPTARRIAKDKSIASWTNRTNLMSEVANALRDIGKTLHASGCTLLSSSLSEDPAGLKAHITASADKQIYINTGNGTKLAVLFWHTYKLKTQQFGVYWFDGGMPTKIDHLNYYTVLEFKKELKLRLAVK